jgi:hypothetical protein
MKTTTALAVLLGMLAHPAWAAEQFYKWTDEQGVTHYSADPPPKSATSTSEVKVSTRLPSDGEDAPPAAPKQDAPDRKDGDKKAADADKPATGKVPPQYAERCKTLQSNLQTMQEHGRVKTTDDKGEVRVLSDEEKQKELDDTQRQIKAFCQ